MTKTYILTLEGLDGALRVEVPEQGNPCIYFNNHLLEPVIRSRSKRCSTWRIAIDGKEEFISFKTDLTMNHMLVWRGRNYRLERSLTKWEFLLCLLPILSVFYGGAIGGAFGGAGFVILASRMRKTASVGMKILLTLGVAALCFLLPVLFLFMFSLIF